MATEQSKSELESILTCIDRKFEIISAKWSDDKNFEAKLRTQVARENIDYNAICDEWVDLFSSVTSTTWVKKISNTGPQIRFRKQYQCWTHPGEVRKELLFDPRRCKATLDIKILTDNVQVRRKNKYIKQGLNTVVKLNFTHLHSIATSKPFAFFVHTCEPLAEVPKVITPTGNISQINNNTISKIKDTQPGSDSSSLNSSPSEAKQAKIDRRMECVTFNQNSLHLQSLENVKLDKQQHAFVSVDVNHVNPPPQYEELVMFQPTLLFEPGQVIQQPAGFSPHFNVQALSAQAQNEHLQY